MLLVNIVTYYRVLAILEDSEWPAPESIVSSELFAVRIMVAESDENWYWETEYSYSAYVHEYYLLSYSSNEVEFEFIKHE